MNRYAGFLAVALLSCSAAAFAAGGAPDKDPAPAAQVDPVVAAARAAIASNDWTGAQKGLSGALARNPQNPDYHNLFAYTTRKGPNPNMDLVFKHYNEALRIDPKHRGAHEYIGEAYLMVNNVAKAKEHLAALDKLCFLSCDEFTDLKKAIGAYEAKAKN